MMTWLVWVWHGVAGCALSLRADLESCVTANIERSVAQGAGASHGYCTPSRLSRQHVGRNSPGMIDQDRRHEVSRGRSCSELARSFRRRQER